MNSTLQTITDYINDSRVLLQDTLIPYRYQDADLVTAMNVTLLEGRRLRPDLFVYHRLVTGQSDVQSLIGNDGTQINIEPQFRLGFLYGMIAHALMRDQEDIQDERAGAYQKMFADTLLGVRPTPISLAQGG